MSPASTSPAGCKALEPTLTLTAEQIAFFRERGYLLLDAITTPEEVLRMRGIFERLFDTRAGWERGKQFDLAGIDAADRAAQLPQLLSPSEFAPELRESLYRSNALRVARQLLGPDAEPFFEHAILKPPRHGAATPWHQDEAHRDDPEVNYVQISIWMPLLEATAANGCMRYLPGSHLGPVLDHRSPGDDPRITALECCGPFDPDQAVACPLPAGGAVIHHCRTLHSAGPNASDIPRPAYILAFRSAVTPNPEPRPYAWNVQKRTAAQARAEAWQKRPAARLAAMGHRLKGRIARVWRRLFPRNF